MDGGTLYQLRNSINRRNVVSSPDNDVNACEDFLNDLNDVPNESIVPPGLASSSQSAMVIE